MKKSVIIYSMMSRHDYEKGIDNTNAHIVRWLENRIDIDTIFYIDFTQFSLMSKMRYALKEKFFLRKKDTVLKRPFFRIDKSTKGNKTIYHGLGLKYKLNEICTLLGIKPSEVWSFNPFDTSFLKILKPAVTIFYSIDDWRKNPLFQNQRTVLEKNYQLIRDAADFIFCPNRNLIETLWFNRSRAYEIKNAVDVNFFSTPAMASEQVRQRIDDLLKNVKRPLIGYLGVITPERIDLDLIEYLARNNGDKTFIFSGPVWGGFNQQRLNRAYSNVKFIGMVYYPEMPYLISKFDVCLIPHKINAFTKSMNPKKIYEYLAAGKPVVTTSVPGTEQFSNVVHRVSSFEDFNSAITESLKKDSSASIQKRLDSVKLHSWELRFQEITKLLTS